MKHRDEKKYICNQVIQPMQWKLTFDSSLHHDEKREILKKHFIKKEPFSKVSIHQMHITEMVENFLESGLRLHIHTDDKEVIVYPGKE